MNKKSIKNLLLDFSNEMNKSKPHQTPPVPLCIGISLKSKQVCNNWTIVQKNLSNTLKSILNNTASNYIIVIAGHEKPIIDEIDHHKVTWLTADFLPPSTPHGFTLDKRKKRMIIGAHLRRLNFSGYYMHLDADDLLHTRFIEYVNSFPIKKGFILEKGIMINTHLAEMWVVNKFHQHCGSSSILYFDTSEFPLNSIKDDSNFSMFTFLSHRHIHRKLRKSKGNMLFINFPIVLRVFGYGDNNMTLKNTLKLSVSAKYFKAMGEKVEEWVFNNFK